MTLKGQAKLCVYMIGLPLELLLTGSVGEIRCELSNSRQEVERLDFLERLKGDITEIWVAALKWLN